MGGTRGGGTSHEGGHLGDYADLLLGYAQLAEGSELTDPVRFNHVLTELMTSRIG